MRALILLLFLPGCSQLFDAQQFISEVQIDYNRDGTVDKLEIWCESGKDVRQVELEVPAL